ncbi:MAG: FAD-dependent oxidoreductase, partial [Planctomycetes bacterium]|nr:FAD-dependent oxidoreductase [Planctomycetota bacterium]
LTRRQALRAAAGAAGAAALAGCALPGLGGRPGRKVVIVGGGVAGLHCAWRLRKMGVLAEVREGARRVGGRMLSDRTTFGRQSCELGAELVDTPHRTMHDLAAEFDLELLDFTKDDPSLAPWVAHVGGRRLGEAEVLEGFAPLAERIDEAFETLADPEGAVTYADPNRGEFLDRQSIRQWLDFVECSGPVRELIEVAYLTEYGMETDVQSALNLLMLISTETERLEIFGESDERYRFRDGNDVVVRKLAASLDPGQVVLGSKLVKLGLGSDGRVSMVFQGDGGTEEVSADHAVLAIPFTLLRQVELDLDLAPAKRRGIEKLGYGTNAKLMVGFGERVWRGQGSNGEVFTDLPFQCSWETSRLQPGAAGIITNFTGGRQGVAVGKGPARDRTADFLAGFDRVFPGAKAAWSGEAVRMHWPSHPWVQGSYAGYLVGQWTTICGSEGERVGNVHFAGEHTSLDFQGFMEGGALTGAMAALEVAADLGIRTADAAAEGGAVGRIVRRAAAARRAKRRLPAEALAHR